MEKIICILPTGDWSEVSAENLPRFIGVSFEQMIQLSEGEITFEDVE